MTHARQDDKRNPNRVRKANEQSKAQYERSECRVALPQTFESANADDRGFGFVSRICRPFHGLGNLLDQPTQRSAALHAGLHSIRPLRGLKFSFVNRSYFLTSFTRKNYSSILITNHLYALQ